MGLLFGKIGYYLVLGWCCVSIFVFMVSWGPLEASQQRMSGGSLDQSDIAELRGPAVGTAARGQEGFLEEGVSKLGLKGREEPSRLLGWAGAHPHPTLLTWWAFLPEFPLV